LAVLLLLLLLLLLLFHSMQVCSVVHSVAAVAGAEIK